MQCYRDEPARRRCLRGALTPRRLCGIGRGPSTNTWEGWEERRGDDGETETEKQKKMEAEAEAETETGKNEERR
jgi:hypothetical protein